MAPATTKLDDLSLAVDLAEALPAKADDPAESAYRVLSAVVLLHAVNDLILRRPEVGYVKAREFLESCKCEPFCPSEAYVFRDRDPSPSELATCDRWRALRKLDEAPAEIWFKSNSDGPFSFLWVCETLQYDPIKTWKFIRTLPKGRPLQLDGKRLYRHCRTSYEHKRRMRHWGKDIGRRRR